MHGRAAYPLDDAPAPSGNAAIELPMRLPVPTFINSSDDFTRIVKLGTTPESSVLEFKKDLRAFSSPLPDERRKGQIEFCRDISSFANSHGGCILIGVDEQRPPGANRGVAGAIHSVDDTAGRTQWMNEAIGNYLVPKTFERSMIPVSVGADTIIAVNVPPSLHLVSLWRDDDSTIQCYRRTDHGKVAMNPDDVERHLMNGSRAARLELARVQAGADLSKPIALVPGVWVWNGISRSEEPFGAQVNFNGSDEHQFQLWLPQNKSIC